MKINFKENIVILGFGSIARCTLPLLLKHIHISLNQIKIFDFLDKKADLAPFIEGGLQFIQQKITEANVYEILNNYVKPGDVLLDLSWSVDSYLLIEWCINNQVKYINTSLEIWNTEALAGQHFSEQTLYPRQLAIRSLSSRVGIKNRPTIILEHGANPGLVSHFVKKGLVDIAEALLKNNPENASFIEQAIRDNQFAELASLLSVKTIHISERDTQITNVPREKNEFINTWSVMGLYEEGVAPAELGWGTHEQSLPEGAYMHKEGPLNQICINKMGMDTWIKSWTPSGEIIGMIIRHGEAFTLSHYLTLKDKEKVTYRPTVHYAYCPTDAAISSLHELRMRQFSLQEKQRILYDEITSGQDELGVLLMGHPFNSWWIGSVLDIHEAES